MKTELKAKFLQHILKKKQEDQGFTLIELLVVIIIIGILSAIALPSFLNQANKGKQSEAKQYVGSLNRSQQAYYLENASFGSSIDQLGIGIKTQTENYKYEIASGSSQVANNGESLKAALKSYHGNVVLSTLGNSSSDATTLAVLCEATSVGVSSTNTAPSGSGTPLQPACPSNFQQLTTK
ncbi:type IV pilin-like G/H family protein [Aetokthonos hydrillicola Thurmond2011]|jgi:prepilin-type N-terminal cleavage/methylation domain-containing protein|uniref:Type IV pilin-like G/H family protein n=1 Tax=Aetokthonos hydrillicola Thurmond2011 TaxID=2712845 RepID=A0AAP5IDW3_9CYAN|nr:type IV pilin-like G/H family protein [Aetokthonos hydrillicola]MBO3457776.1 prepilin-type N-terminal cleavage/methylation domain-containing protein [Aetokthonos hydrillicola CCALA 1050]MBW4589373.1 type IV pilin-like G/H family protein [Aetokthonos hydrillicola CCALA 1050]MDR9897150.1 type IV pilin-like G/H family protein [Aetokthonos hydrillicola Thurmond2011]